MKTADVYKGLREKHGEPAGQWTLWCKRPKTAGEKELVVIESILTQRANWNNVTLAVQNLRAAGAISLKKILKSETKQLGILIRPSGFYTIKAQRLQTIADFMERKCGGIKAAESLPADELRRRLLALNGVGEETADSILLYAFEKPVFVIDEYTRRLVKKLDLTDNFSYRRLQEFFEQGLGEKNYAAYQDFHALIVIDGKTTVKGAS